MEISKGQIVMSRAGRDICRWYVVVGKEEDRILLANGEKFTLLAPKRKNVHHISPANTVLSVEDMETDNQLKQALDAHCKRS